MRFSSAKRLERLLKAYDDKMSSTTPKKAAAGKSAGKRKRASEDDDEVVKDESHDEKKPGKKGGKKVKSEVKKKTKKEAKEEETKDEYVDEAYEMMLATLDHCDDDDENAIGSFISLHSIPWAPAALRGDRSNVDADADADADDEDDDDDCCVIIDPPPTSFAPKPASSPTGSSRRIDDGLHADKTCDVQIPMTLTPCPHSTTSSIEEDSAQYDNFQYHPSTSEHAFSTTSFSSWACHDNHRH